MSEAKAAAERIERILDELRGVSGPHAWRKIEELVTRFLTIYGEGLDQMLLHAREMAGSRSLELDQRLAADELVSSLLLLHGLHPQSTEVRARNAITALDSVLAEHGATVELVDATGGAVRLSLKTAPSCGSSRHALEGVLRRTIEDAAPEVREIEIDGISETRSDLVQIGGNRR
jgi:Fe-S cluster biogenesis protein NfuA